MRGINPSYRLLADQAAISDRKLKRIFNSMQAGDRKKSTKPGRFSELDEVIAHEVVNRFPGTIRIHELGAANAITSLELFNRLSRDRDVHFRASDYYDSIRSVRLYNVDFIFDACDQPLQIGVGKIGFPSWVAPARLWQKAVGILGGRINLFHPAALALARSNPHFTLGRDDFYDPHPGPYDVVRLMNGIPQDASAEQRQRIVDSLAGTVAPNGLLVVGRKRIWTIYLKRDGIIVPLIESLPVQDKPTS